MSGAKKLDDSIFDYVRDYKEWEETGFTDKKLEWSPLKELKEIKKISLKELWEETK